MSKPLDLKDKKFGRLYVLERIQNDSHGRSLWKCRCDCGNIKIVIGTELKNGRISSCGCLHKENFKFYKHGLSNTRMFYIWQAMKFRCSNPKCKEYNSYGGKGIKVCNEWLTDFMNFYNWAINNGYADNLSIDRIDVNGNYCPENCRWVNNITQCNNKSDNRYVTYHGDTDTFSNMCRKLNVNSKTIYGRLRHKNRTFEQAVDDFSYTSPFVDYKYP